MEPASVRTKVPPFLSDLGKATLRGIRKCPCCGTYNGTRGLSCKNKNCGTVFRHGTRKQPGVDAVRIVTGSDSQVYSVRQRERGPDQRCFVELGVSETAIETAEGTVITQLSSGRCHVPSCLKAAAQDVAENRCQHVRLALTCQTEATPLALKSSVLHAMPASPETKQTLWQLATEPTGPLVQRVTKNVLVVKCKASQRHGLGYLHASVAPKASARALGEHRFSCSCQAPKPGKGGSAEEEPSPSPSPRCIHFFACLCAFASDESLAQEFADILACDAGGLQGNVVPRPVGGPESPGPAGGAGAAQPRKRRKAAMAGAQATSPLLAPDPARSHPRRSSLKPPAVASSPRSPGCTPLLDESQVTFSFQDWLASVTERIHQTMHYQFEGKPEPLVFHIPQAFFDALQQRISSGSTKKRLPNSTTGTPSPWAPSPSTPGTSPASCRSSRSSTRPRKRHRPRSLHHRVDPKHPPLRPHRRAQAHLPLRPPAPRPPRGCHRTRLHGQTPPGNHTINLPEHPLTPCSGQRGGLQPGAGGDQGPPPKKLGRGNKGHPRNPQGGSSPTSHLSLHPLAQPGHKPAGLKQKHKSCWGGTARTPPKQHWGSGSPVRTPRASPAA
ncbi:uncharacterized protein C2orf42 homolog isoform X3 [Nyctibius grandis]|uniref:uncharacterized protein C2orf42 homolog isoform X3 n=1 Tax=Nyctibius grandis TaxID=48427 RepID=UPI0035BC32CB